MNYPMYGNSNQYYMQNLQDMRDRIDNQLKNYQNAQMQQPVTQPITQNFQISPSTTNTEIEGKYANSIDDVKNTFVIKTGIFVNRDYSILWIKDVSGNIRTFKTEEIIEMDDRDKEIYMLKKQIEEMKGMIVNANESVSTNVDEQIAETKSTRVSNAKRSNAK